MKAQYKTALRSLITFYLSIGLAKKFIWVPELSFLPTQQVVPTGEYQGPECWGFNLLLPMSPVYFYSFLDFTNAITIKRALLGRGHA